MKKPHEKILEILNSESTLDWQDQNNAIFTVGNQSKKFINGTLFLPQEGPFSLNITDTNYTAGYLSKKIGSAASALELDFYKSQNNMSFFAMLKPGDHIWVFSDSYPDLHTGNPVLLSKNTDFYKVNGGALLCNPAGSLKVAINAIFNGYQLEKCVSGDLPMSYAVFQLQ